METIPIRSIRTDSNNKNFFKTFSIRDISELLMGNDLVQDLHRHDFYFIMILKKGEGEHFIDFVPYNIKNHSIFFLRPGQVHKLVLKKGSTGFLMQFKKDFYHLNDSDSRILLRRAGGKNFCQLDSEQFIRINEIMTNIQREYINRKERYAEVIKANLSIFLIELFRHRQNNKEMMNNNISFTNDRLDELYELIEDNISKRRTAAYYAGRLNMSNYQLNALIKSSLGITFSKLVNEHILLESKRYLLATSKQVKEIAYDLGFEDVSYFIRFFKKHIGSPPEVFRNVFK
jgi:AraC family transcriptional regulator, transcriptional activator of pobA